MPLNLSATTSRMVPRAAPTPRGPLTRVRIASFTEEANVTLYRLTVTSSDAANLSMQTWEVKRRFSSFETLHAAVQQQLQLPPFQPSKHLFHTMTVKTNRASQLEDFIRCAMRTAATEPSRFEPRPSAIALGTAGRRLKLRLHAPYRPLSTRSSSSVCIARPRCGSRRPWRTWRTHRRGLTTRRWRGSAVRASLASLPASMPAAPPSRGPCCRAPT
jgi:hypothetical protein